MTFTIWRIRSTNARLAGRYSTCTCWSPLEPLKRPSRSEIRSI